MARSKFEIKAEKELKEEGWIVDSKAGMNRWASNTDYFHLFDLLAIKPKDIMRFIAIKGQSGVPKSLRDGITNFYLPSSCQKEIWQYRKIKGQGNKFIPRKEIIT